MLMAGYPENFSTEMEWDISLTWLLILLATRVLYVDDWLSNRYVLYETASRNVSRRGKISSKPITLVEARGVPVFGYSSSSSDCGDEGEGGGGGSSPFLPVGRVDRSVERRKPVGASWWVGLGVWVAWLSSKAFRRDRTSSSRTLIRIKAVSS